MKGFLVFKIINVMTLAIWPILSSTGVEAQNVSLTERGAANLLAELQFLRGQFKDIPEFDVSYGHQVKTDSVYFAACNDLTLEEWRKEVTPLLSIMTSITDSFAVFEEVSDRYFTQNILKGCNPARETAFVSQRTELLEVEGRFLWNALVALNIEDRLAALKQLTGLN